MMMKNCNWMATAVALLFCFVAAIQAESPAYVRVSGENPRYFELSDGTPYIPIGVNLCVLREVNDGKTTYFDSTDKGLERYEHYFQKLSENGGNYARIWLASDFFEVERTAAGVYDDRYFERVDRLLELAKKYNIRLKLCFEQFRYISPKEGGPAIFHKDIYALNPPSTIRQWVESDAGKAMFFNRCRAFAERYREHPNVFGWELWNEMNCLPGFRPWTAEMLPKIQELFPNHLVMQSLGSFDRAGAIDEYREICLLLSNDVAQVHRYLDPGAKLDVCRGPMAELNADAVRTLRSLEPNKPIMATEAGAVEASHSGPSKLYPLDKEGILLHDILFAPFFVGAAGTGHCWHWEVYIDKNNLWPLIGRFSKAIRGINPIAERFEPFEEDQSFFHLYGLAGKTTTLLWLRDRETDWKTELIEKISAPTRSGVAVDLKNFAPNAEKVQFYDPWRDSESTLTVQDGKITLPDFVRSCVLRIEK